MLKPETKKFILTIVNDPDLTPAHKIMVIKELVASATIDYTNGVYQMLLDVAEIREAEGNYISAKAHRRGAESVRNHCQQKKGPLTDSWEPYHLKWVGHRIRNKIDQFMHTGKVVLTKSTVPSFQQPIGMNG